MNAMQLIAADFAERRSDCLLRTRGGFAALMARHTRPIGQPTLRPGPRP